MDLKTQKKTMLSHSQALRLVEAVHMRAQSPFLDPFPAPGRAKNQARGGNSLYPPLSPQRDKARGRRFSERPAHPPSTGALETRGCGWTVFPSRPCRLGPRDGSGKKARGPWEFPKPRAEEEGQGSAKVAGGPMVTWRWRRGAGRKGSPP